MEMVRLSGIGPKGVRAIADTLDIGSIEDLEMAAASGALRDVPGLGTKRQARILRAPQRRRDEHGRVLRGDPLPRAEALQRELSKLPGALIWRPWSQAQCNEASSMPRSPTIRGECPGDCTRVSLPARGPRWRN